MLFNTIEEFQDYIPVNKSFTLQRIAKYLEQVEAEHIKPVLGKVLFTQLQADYAAASDQTAHLALLHKVRLATSSLAFFRYMPYGQVQVSDAGIRVAQDDDYRNAYKWQIEKLEDRAEQSGFDFIEQLLVFLEENQADYPTWDFARNHQYFVNAATAFNEEVFIGESRLLYLKMLPQMKRIERIVRNRISRSYFTELKSKLADPATVWTELEEELLEYLRNGIANLTFAEAIRSLPVQMEGNQLSIFNNQFLADFDPKVHPDMDTLAYMQRIHREQGEESLQSAIYFMDMHIDDFPLYRDSDCYMSAEELDDIDMEDSGFFIV